MKALAKISSGEGGLSLIDVPEPSPAPGQVKIRVRAGCICGTDLGILSGKWKVTPPRILGHEISGVVAEVGEGVQHIQVGDRVTTETDAYLCGECEYCRSGNEHLCLKRTGIGTTADGGFTEYLTVRAEGVHRLPDATTLAAGALSEPLAVAVHAVIERGQVQPGEWILIIGPGTIGLLAAQVALSCGAQVIVGGLARHTARFALARRLGIAHTLDLEDAQQIENLRDLTHGLGPHRIIECSGSLSAAQSALQMVRKTGSLVFVGYFYQNVALDFDLLINKEVSQIGSRGKRHSTWPMVLDLLARGQVDTETLITHRFPLDNWETAFTRAKQSGAKVLLEINSVV